jgi:hypothetical protein
MAGITGEAPAAADAEPASAADAEPASAEGGRRGTGGAHRAPDTEAETEGQP